MILENPPPDAAKAEEDQASETTPPPAAATALRRHVADSPDRETARPLTTLGGVEPVIEQRHHGRDRMRFPRPSDRTTPRGLGAIGPCLCERGRPAPMLDGAGTRSRWFRSSSRAVAWRSSGGINRRIVYIFLILVLLPVISARVATFSHVAGFSLPESLTGHRGEGHDRSSRISTQSDL
jgi:hypothetical protein